LEQAPRIVIKPMGHSFKFINTLLTTKDHLSLRRQDHSYLECGIL
jgi:hypothetical protein